MTPLALTDFTLATPLGAGRAANLAALRENRSALVPCRFENFPHPTFIGEIPALDSTPLTGALARFDCRNNRLAQFTLAQDDFSAAIAAARTRFGAARIGVVVGTSTSGLLHTEHAYRHRDPLTGALPDSFDYARTHNTYSLAAFIRAACALTGPAFVISTACAASAKVFASAARLIETGLIDAAIIGGCDTLCATTLFGFHALGVIAEQPCRPFDAARTGISIGEAAAFALLERPAPHHDSDTIFLLGAGESADAHHMSAPHPEGEGARTAMQHALTAAGLPAGAIGYINLHGTATPAGDAAEDIATAALFPTPPASSTKGFTGHTLGASGAIEAAFCALAIRHNFIPGSPHTDTLDPEFRTAYVTQPRARNIRRAMSNSFGFGGANCSLILGAAP
jgi:3-oxoacyl-[acyl-carrier-protein] synthase-1